MAKNSFTFQRQNNLTELNTLCKTRMYLFLTKIIPWSLHLAWSNSKWTSGCDTPFSFWLLQGTGQGLQQWFFPSIQEYFLINCALLLFDLTLDFPKQIPLCALCFWQNSIISSLGLIEMRSNNRPSNWAEQT